MQVGQSFLTKTLFPQNDNILLGFVVGARKATLIVLLVITLVFVSFPQIDEVNAQSVIYIRANGSVEGIDKIQRNENVYTLIENIYGNIIVEKNDIILDGAGFTLSGHTGRTGIELTNRSNVIIKNIEITTFGTGIYIQASSFNRVLNSTIKNSINGIHITDLWLGSYGIHSNHNIVEGNNITSNTEYGIKLTRHSDQNIVTENIITNNKNGIYVDFFSVNNTISKNNVKLNTDYGIHLDYYSDNCTIIDNTIVNNGKGLLINRCSNNLLRNNTMEDNSRNFEVQGTSINDIDTSNTVNGKPIYYWIGKSDMTVPNNAGYVVLVKCENITIQDLILSNNLDGILLISTNNIMITRNELKNCGSGIHLWSNSDKISIIENNITGNSYGIHLNEGKLNTIYGNNIENNSIGVYVVDSYANHIYHNNFINNTEQFSFNAFWMPPFVVPARVNTWGNSFELGGNYWSDYEQRYPNASKLDDSGFWNTSYILAENNIDYYPLMNPVNIEMIPEFPSWTILPLFLTATLIGILVRKRLVRTRQKPLL